MYFEQDAGAEFDPVLGYDPDTGYPLFGGVTSDELYNYGFDDFQGFPNTRDVGLVILDEPVLLDEYASLAVAGSLDRLATRRGVDFAYRTDQADVIAWILEHAPADERDDIQIVAI